MSITSSKKLLTAAEYEALVDEGILSEDDRVELIEGEVVEMTPIGPPHDSRVIRLSHLFIKLLGDRALVGVQTSARLSDITQPQPDFVILRRREDYYAKAHPGPSDILCLIEVADTSLRFDRGRKGKLYAGYGILDYWIVNLPKNLLEVRRDPGPDGYASLVTLRRGDRVSLAAFPDLIIDVAELLPLP